MAVVVFDELRSEIFSDIDITFVAVGGPLEHKWRAFKITNVTDQDVIVSLDGTTDQIYVPSFGFTLYDLSTNSPPFGTNDNLVLPIGTQFYVRYVEEPESGNVYIEGLYARGE